MKTLVSLLLTTFLTVTGTAENYDLHFGTIEAPQDFVFKRTGTADSFMGTLTRTSDGFTITFDVGDMSGMIADETHAKKWTYFRKHIVGGWPARTGIENVNEVRRIESTVGDLRERHDPANFWTDIRRDTDIADFLLIVGTYKPKTKENAQETGTCEVHKTAMIKKTVPIIYGLPTLSGANPSTRAKLFPHSRELVFGGCSEMAEKTRDIYICSDCQRAEAAWNNPAGRKR